MRIMMIANDTTFIYNLRREVLQGFLKEGHQVAVVGQVNGFQRELEELGIEVIELVTKRKSINPIEDISLLKRYQNCLKLYLPDIVFTNNIKPNVYAGIICRKNKIPYVANITGLGTAIENKSWYQMIAIQLYKHGVKGAKAIFFQNNENYAFFEKHRMIRKDTKVITLPGSGVNLSTYFYEEYPKSEIIKFLFAARIMKEKGIDVFLETAKYFRTLRNDVEFHICGMCDDVKYLDVLNKYQDAGYIQYHGLQKNMSQFYKECSCYLYPSYYPEGMSNVLLEAAASGRPLITTERAGCGETVDQGISGYKVPINDVKRTIEAVEQFLNLSWEERRDMGKSGRVKMEKKFDRNIVVTEYLKIIRDM